MRLNLFQSFSILTLCLLTAGCATSSSESPLAWLRGPNAKASEEGDKKDEKLAKKNPFKSDKAEDSSGKDSKEQLAKTEKSAADKKSVPTKSETKTVSHDPETLKLIEEASKDMAPEEQKQFFADMKDLKPSMVRLIVNTRKMTLAMQEKKKAREQEGASQQITLAGNPPQNQNIAPQARYQQPQLPQAQAGLGAANPWGQPAGNPNVYTVNFPGGMTAGQPVAWNQAQPSGVPTQRGPSGPYNPNQAVQSQQAGLNPSQTTQFGLRNPIQFDPQQTQQAFNQQGSIQPNQNRSQFVAGNRPVQGATTYAQPVGQQQTGFLPSANQGQSAMPANGIIQAGSEQSAPKNWYRDLERLISQVEADAMQATPGTTDEEKRKFIEKQVYLRMLYLMAGHQERGLAPIAGIDAADQEFWQQMFWSIANYFDARQIPDASDRATQTIAQLRSAVERLQEKARLDLRNMTFCHKISSYGNFERFARDEFSPGQPVLLYAEVDNFKSEPTTDGQYRTILKSTIEIYRAGSNGERIEEIPFTATEDLSKNPRRDYFHSYQFDIPPRIALGPHVLKLTVEDQLSRKVSSTTLNFTVK